MRPSIELSDEELGFRIASLMPESPEVNLFANCCAQFLDYASFLDDLSFVRMGRKAEVFEAEFRDFLAEFPGNPASPVPEGDLNKLGLFLGRMDRHLRRGFLQRLADAVRKAQSKSEGTMTSEGIA